MDIIASLSEIPAGIIDKFGVDLPLLIAQAINFLIVASLSGNLLKKDSLNHKGKREENCRFFKERRPDQIRT